MLLLLGSVALSSAQDDKKLKKQEQAENAYATMKEVVEAGHYNFVADRLISSTGYSNSIVTTPNNILVHDGETQIYLPYFGEVRANSPYQVDGGIKYEGPLEDYSLEFKDSKRRILVKFSIDRGIEEHNFIMSINKDGHARVTVVSSGRTSISYYGRVTALEDGAGS